MAIPEVFEHLAKKYLEGPLGGLKNSLNKSHTGIIFEIYITRILFYSVLAFAVAGIYSMIMLVILGMPLPAAIILGIVSAMGAGGLVAAIFYLYPKYVAGSKKKSIEANLPFAANHMSALATSGVPPHMMFRMLTDATEYGEIAKEARRIVRNLEIYGMDAVSAIRQASAQSPSEQWAQFLSGIAATITSGGDLRAHLQVAAHDALADYRIRREKYMSTLSTYADFYVGVLIAAPLFFISILSLLAIIGGQIAGISVQTLIVLGIYVLIPVLNIVFLLFVHLTQPAL